MYAFFETNYEGTILQTHNFTSDCEFNHVQLIEGDRVAILSDKVNNMFLRYNLDTRQTEWIAGGTLGTLELIDDDGTVHAAGDSLWFGQHNAEYFGNDEYFLFDDG